MRTYFIVLLLLVSSILSAQVPYTMQSSTEAFSPLSGASAFTWTTLTANDEEYSDATNIFDGAATFTYCGTAFTQFKVSTNGFLMLGTALASGLVSDNLSGTNRSIIAPLWDDLAVSTTASDITYQLSGTPGSYVLTIEWRNVKWNKTAATANAEFQVKLYQGTNNIEFIYGAMSAPTAGSASIGLVDNSTITSTTNPSTGKFLGINVGGTDGSRVYHQTRSYLFNAISNHPNTNTKLAFTAVTPTPLTAGTYTVGTGKTYTTISAAAQALNIHGVAGPVVFEIDNGTYDDIIHLINVAGTSGTNTITIKPASGATVVLTPLNGSGTSTTAASFTSDAIVRFDGTQFTMLENLSLVGNTLSTAATKFEGGIFAGNAVNPDGTMLASARFNHFKNLTIDSKSTAGASNAGTTCIRYFTTSSTETDTGKTVSYNTIEGCTLTGFWRAGWKNFGISGTNPDRGNVIKNSVIGNLSITAGASSDIRAIEMDCHANFTIANNTISNIESTIMTTNNIYGIWLNPSASTSNLISGTISIYGNTIHTLLNSGAGTTTGFAAAVSSNNVATGTVFNVYNNKVYNIYSNGSTSCRAVGIGLFMSTGTGASLSIYNNMISDLRAPRSTSTPGVRGFDLQNAGGTGTFNVYNNSVLLNDDVPPTNAAHQSAGIYWANFGTGTLDLRNNIIVNTMSTSTGKAVCLYPSANTNYVRLAATTDYNLYFSGATPTANQGISWDATTLRQTLAAHQTAVATGGLGGPRDVNAASKAVNFVSVSDLHLTGATLGDNDLIGTVLGSVTTDIDGHTRNAYYPYKGADENTATVLPRTNFTVPMTAGISNAAAFGSTGKVGSDGAGVDFYAHWDATYLYLGWTGGKTNYSSDLYYAAIDTDPDGTNGSTNAIEGVSFQTGAAKPDYYVVFENNSAFYGVPVTDGNAIEFYNVSGGAWNWVSRTGGNDNTASRVSFTDANGEVRLRIPWTSLGSITPGAGQKLGITMWNNNATANYMWARLPNENPANGATPKVLSHQMLFNSTASGLSPVAAWSTGLLPVELSSLNAAVSGTSVTLKWTTATEVNSYQFQIEQRSLSTEWSTVSSVQASGNSNSPKNYQYTVRSLTSGKYEFRLKMIDADGSFEYSEPVAVEISTPMEFSLGQNYPNPFNPTTTLNYALPFQGNVQLLVYSINGELVKTLVSEVQAAGSYSVTFDASQLASGTYIYRLTATDAAGKNFTDTKKMLLMK